MGRARDAARRARAPRARRSVAASPTDIRSEITAGASKGNSFAPHGDAVEPLVRELSSPQERAPRRAALAAAPARAPGAARRRAFRRARWDRSRSRHSEEGCPTGRRRPLQLSGGRARAGALPASRATAGEEALHVAFYASHGFYSDMRAWGALEAGGARAARRPRLPGLRVEGPGTILHFKGYPHVHAYVAGGARPCARDLGESLGATPAGIEGERSAPRPRGERCAAGPAKRWRSMPTRSRAASRRRDHDRPRLLARPLPQSRGGGVDPGARDGRRAAGAAGGSAGFEVPSDATATGWRPRNTSRRSPRSSASRTPSKRGDLLLRDALVAHLRAGGLADAAG